MSNEQQLPIVRRVITGHTDAAAAVVLLDGPVPNIVRGKSGGTVFHLWNTDRTPADIAAGEGIEDVGRGRFEVPPPRGGTRFVVADYPPGNAGVRHRTETVDYIAVLAGEIDVEMDDGTVTLRAGDVMVQRGGYHTWRNRGPAVARLAVVLVDADPLGIGRPQLRAE
jgi:quercetin dioxygenase-like cupin family protein